MIKKIKVKVKGKTIELDENEAAKILVIQDLTEQIKRLANKYDR